MGRSVAFIRFWMPAVACMVCWGCGVGLIGTYGMFVTPVAAEFDASVAMINTGLVLLLVVMAVLSPVAGWLADRLSARALLLFGALAGMLALFLVSRAPSLLLALSALAGFGIGLSFYSRAPITAFLAREYPADLGRALAIAAVGLSIVSMLLPAWIGWLLETRSWRDALGIMAATLAAILVIFIIAGVRGGTWRIRGSAPTEPAQPRPRPTPAERPFLRQPAFWLIGLSVALFYTVVVTLSISFPAHLRNIGIAQGDIGLMLAVGGSGGLLGKLVFGMYSDRLRSHVHRLALLLVLVKMVGVGVLLTTTEIPLLVMGMILSGFGSGVFIPMHPFLNSCYFDQRVIGGVNGSQAPMMLPFSLAGVPLAGYVFDVTGSYRPVFLGLVVVLAISLVLMMFLPRPKFAARPRGAGAVSEAEPPVDAAGFASRPWRG